MGKWLASLLGMMVVGLLPLAVDAGSLVTDTSEFSGSVMPDGWSVDNGSYLSPEYSNSVRRLGFSYAVTGSGQVGEAQLFAIDHASGDETLVTSVNTLTTNVVFDFPASSDFRRFRIVTNGLAPESFFATWFDSRPDAPANVSAVPLTTDSIEVSWGVMEGASGYEVSVWTNILIGVAEGSVVWADMLPGATYAASSTRMGDDKFNSCFANVGWTRSDKAGYPTGENGTMRIGIADVSGWIQTPAIAISESGMAIRFCARAEEMNSKSMAIAVELVSGNEVSISYAVELTTEMKEFVIPANAWQHGNCVRFNSLASGNRKVVIGAVAVLSGYSEGTATPDMLKVVPTGVTTSCTVGGLPDSAVVYAGVRTMGAEGMSSDISEGVKVDLSKVDTLNAIRMSTLADNTYSQDFDSLAGLTMSSHDTEFFNGVTVPFMQAWQDGIAASSIVHYSGGNQSGAKFLALSTNVSSSARAFGARGKQGTMMVWGIAFTNDTDVAVALTGVSYSAQQWGFANTTNQTLDFSCLVTNRLDWIVGNTCGWRSCIETEAKVFADAHDMPESTIVDYVPSDGMRIAPGEVVYLRWTLYPPVKGQSSTMAIDDLTVTFESAVQQMFIRIVQNAKMP